MTTQQNQTTMDRRTVTTCTIIDNKDTMIKVIVDKCQSLLGQEEEAVVRNSCNSTTNPMAESTSTQHDSVSGTMEGNKDGVMHHLFCIMPLVVEMAKEGFDSGALLQELSVLEDDKQNRPSSSTMKKTIVSLSSRRPAGGRTQSIMAKRAKDAIQVIAYATLVGNNTFVVTFVRQYCILVPLFDALELLWSVCLLEYGYGHEEESRKNEESLTMMLCLVLDALERIFDVYLNGFQFSKDGCHDMDIYEVVGDLLSYYNGCGYDVPSRSSINIKNDNELDGDDGWNVFKCLEDIYTTATNRQLKQRAYKILKKIFEVEEEGCDSDDEEGGWSVDLKRLPIVPFDKCVKKNHHP